MKIEILGTGCSKCKKLAEEVEKTVKELSVDAEIVKVTKIEEMIKRGVMMTPALIIDGDVKAVGKIPAKGEIEKWVSGK